MGDKFSLMGDRDAAGKMVAADGGLGAGGRAGGGTVGDAGMSEQAEGGETKADRWGDCGDIGNLMLGVRSESLA